MLSIIKRDHFEIKGNVHEDVYFIALHTHLIKFKFYIF